jgi:hypothetical protein
MTDLKETADYMDASIGKYIGDTEQTEITNRTETRSQFMENLLLVLFDWRVIFFTLLVIILLSAYAIGVIYKMVAASGKFDVYALNGISFAGHIFILNCFLAMFTLSYYFFKRGHVGRKGPGGERGSPGEQGKNEECDICSLKIKTFKTDSETQDNVMVDDSLFSKTNDMKTKKWKEKTINKILGDAKKCPQCKNDKSADISYITGIIANYDKMITSLQYLYINADGKTDTLGNIWGDKEAKLNIKQVKCPKGSAIYRMDSVFDYDKGIKGLKIFCKNLETGKTTDPAINFIGEEPLLSSNFKYASAKCGSVNSNNNKLPSFLSGLSAKHDKQIHSLSFKTCKYFD